MSTSWQSQTTADGSITFFSPEFRETFHSSSGARQEAEQKFVIPSKLANLAQQVDQLDQLTILDVCYGLGYNSAAALEAVWAVNPNCRVELLALELDISVAIAALDFLSSYSSLVQEHLTTLANRQEVQTPQLRGRLAIGDARQTLQKIPKSWQADVIFLDPFSPPKCPQLWTVEFIALLAQFLKPHGKLVTYSCAAAVRQALVMAGLNIASTPSVGRKSPGTIASFATLDFPPLSQSETEYLQTRAATPYRDVHLQDNVETIMQRRQQEQLSSPLEPTKQWQKRWH
jgi:tRNA U34 5-methylaminomethyl-2-thiouridine-forming methyltransferase MnmC